MVSGTECNGTLWRHIRYPIGADGGNLSQPLLRDNTLHIDSEPDSHLHCRPAARSVLPFAHESYQHVGPETNLRFKCSREVIQCQATAAKNHCTSDRKSVV